MTTHEAADVGASAGIEELRGPLDVIERALGDMMIVGANLRGRQRLIVARYLGEVAGAQLELLDELDIIGGGADAGDHIVTPTAAENGASANGLNANGATPKGSGGEPSASVKGDGAGETNDAAQTLSEAILARPVDGRSIERLPDSLLAAFNQKREPDDESEAVTAIVIKDDRVLHVGGSVESFRVRKDGITPSVTLLVINTVFREIIINGKGHVTLERVIEIIDNPETSSAAAYQALQRFLKTGVFVSDDEAGAAQLSLPRHVKILDERPEPDFLVQAPVR